MLTVAFFDHWTWARLLTQEDWAVLFFFGVAVAFAFGRWSKGGLLRAGREQNAAQLRHDRVAVVDGSRDGRVV